MADASPWELLEGRHFLGFFSDLFLIFAWSAIRSLKVIGSLLPATVHACALLLSWESEPGGINLLQGSHLQKKVCVHTCV